MRLSLIAFLLAAAAAPLAAQTGTITTPQPAQVPRPRPAPYLGRDPYYYDRYRFPPPTASMDSAARAVEMKYEGWHVNSKALIHERNQPIFVFNMVAAGVLEARRVEVDGDTGEILNPEVMGDSTSYGREHRHRRYRSATYP